MSVANGSAENILKPHAQRKEAGTVTTVVLPGLGQMQEGARGGFCGDGRTVYLYRFRDYIGICLYNLSIKIYQTLCLISAHFIAYELYHNRYGWEPTKHSSDSVSGRSQPNTPSQVPTFKQETVLSLLQLGFVSEKLNQGRGDDSLGTSACCVSLRALVQILRLHVEVRQVVRIPVTPAQGEGLGGDWRLPGAF